MLPLHAAIRTDATPTDGRRTVRRTLRLEVQAFAAGNATEALIHNLSETGLLIETSAALKVGETLQVELPESGSIDARIVWTRGSFFGCEFGFRVAKATVSAALLRSPGEASPQPRPPGMESRRISADHDYPPVETTNQVGLYLSLLLSLAVVVLFLIALAL
jgi:hypothetical protein